MQRLRERRLRRVRSSSLSFLLAAVAAIAPGHASSYAAEEAEAASGGVAVKAISVGTWHTCAVGTDGIVRCWGWNPWGQVGPGREKKSASPVRVPIDHVVTIAAGRTHSCALDAGGTVWCWGENRDGELGDGTRDDRADPAPVRGLGDVVDIAAGADCSCAVRVDGTVFCWGNGILGTLGDGRNHTSDLPVPVTGITNAVAVTVGEGHACAVHSSGRVSCWGRDTWGELGDGTKDDSNLPRPVVRVQPGPSGWTSDPIEGVVSVGAGYAHTCVAHADGTVSCWGANWYGQCGAAAKTESSSARTVAVTRAKAVAAGNLDTCALLSDGTARCWGANGNGQLGDPTMSREEWAPVTPRVGEGDARHPLSDLVAIRTGDTTCAVDASGTMWCWGAGYAGQLGDGTLRNRAVPAPVLPLP